MAEIINDNVGKKIVEALRMQDKQITEPVKEETEKVEKIQSTEEDTNENILASSQDVIEDDSLATFSNANTNINVQPSLDLEAVLQSTIDNNMNNMNLSNLQSDFEYPNNVAILNHLISKLPAGVTKQTGAVIIRQTMEALGIPMKSVIREAQQVQETLASRTRECQKNIIDARKQIASLEIKVQQYQKQAVVMNDIINLFISTGV